MGQSDTIVISGEKEVIPKSWKWVKIEDISEKSQYGFTTKAVDNGDIFLLRTTDITNGPIQWKNVPFCRDNPDDLEKYKLNEGDILISRAGSVGESYLVDDLPYDNVVFASYLIRFKSRINNKYFKYFLNSPRYWNAITEEKSGIAVPNVNATKLNNIKIPLPPTEVQQQIVQKIEELFSELDSGIENLQKAKQQLETYRQSVLKAAFEGELTREWREQQDSLPSPEKLRQQIEEERKRYCEQQLKKWEQNVEGWKEQGEHGRKPRKPKKSKSFDDPTEEELNKLKSIPNYWYWEKLGKVSRSKGGYAFKSKSLKKSGKYQVIRMGNIRPGKLRLNERPVFLNDVKKKVKDKALLKKGDVIITLTGTRKKRDYGYSVMIEKENLLLNQRIAYLRFNDKINPLFFLYYSWNESFKDQFFSYETGNVGQGNVSMSALSDTVIPITSLEEQNKIVEFIDLQFSVIEQTEKTIGQELQKAEALRQSILKKAFEGKLVTQ